MNVVDENIIKVLGIEKLPDEQKVRILEKSAKLVEQRLLLRLMKSVSDVKRDQLNEILSADRKEELNAFIQQEAPDFFNWVLDETTQLKQELKDLGEPKI